MSKQAIKDLLKPPFTIIVGGEGTALPSANICDAKYDVICTLSPAFYDAKDFILAAMNKKWEKENA